ncbi:Hypothetical predicted protein [Octopus vulgaris]|uniref:Uncharacterized protein n=1 Tax=Octopus vulgaris TaxID=6645 RepID=A0AA36F8Y6_OCTVU|nr:Hypothetical predicted protein [Octopus vulgaris]
MNYLVITKYEYVYVRMRIYVFMLIEMVGSIDDIGQKAFELRIHVCGILAFYPTQTLTGEYHPGERLDWALPGFFFLANQTKEKKRVLNMKTTPNLREEAPRKIKSKYISYYNKVSNEAYFLIVIVSSTRIHNGTVT